MVGESPVARLHIVVRAERGQVLPDVDAAELEARWPPRSGPGTTTWPRRRSASSARSARARCSPCAAASAIPQTYKTDVPGQRGGRRPGEDPRAARVGRERRVRPVGIRGLRRRGADRGHRAAGAPAAAPRVWRLTIYRSGSPITLTDVLPGCSTWASRWSTSTRTSSAPREPFWIYDFGLRRSTSGRRRPARAIVGRVGQGAVTRTRWPRSGAGTSRTTGSTRWCSTAHLTWRQVVVLRAYAKYLRQAGSTFSQNYIERVLRSQHHDHPAAGAAVRVPVRPGPAGGRGRAQRGHHRGDPRRAGRGGQPRPGPHPARLPGADPGHAADELLRQPVPPTPQTPYLVVKLDAAQVPDLPAPRPAFELFVYSPGSRACTCGSPAWPGAACAGRTGGRTSAPRSSAWPRRRR